MLSSMQGLGGQYYAVGRFKILMMPEARTVLDKCKEKAALLRNTSAEKLKKAFSIYLERLKLKRGNKTLNVFKPGINESTTRKN
jgi:acid phosphatase family membrane protein YuiD